MLPVVPPRRKIAVLVPFQLAISILAAARLLSALVSIWSFVAAVVVIRRVVKLLLLSTGSAMPPMNPFSNISYRMSAARHEMNTPPKIDLKFIIVKI